MKNLKITITRVLTAINEELKNYASGASYALRR